MPNDPMSELAPETHALAEPISDHDARRIHAFQLKCATARAQTQQELARLATKRAAVRTQLGISSERMAQWRDEHQRLLQPQGLAPAEP